MPIYFARSSPLTDREASTLGCNLEELGFRRHDGCGSVTYRLSPWTVELGNCQACPQAHGLIVLSFPESKLPDQRVIDAIIASAKPTIYWPQTYTIDAAVITVPDAQRLLTADVHPRAA